MLFVSLKARLVLFGIMKKLLKLMLPLLKNTPTMKTFIKLIQSTWLVCLILT
jgi:hypothetical protein